MKKNLLIAVVSIISYFGITILNNIRNILNILMGINKSITFISIHIVISLIIFLFYIYKIRKKLNNKYLTISLITMLLFYNICNGVLYSANIQTFFILFVILMIDSLYVYFKLKNFSFSLIITFSILIIITMLLGMIGLLNVVKYLIPLSSVICLLLIYKQGEKNIGNTINEFFNKELIIFIILFIIAIIGGIGRYVHVYDEYSHWAYDAKAVIYYDKLSTSQEIMSASRSYAPILTSWHYIVAQYSEFSESNLYIGLSIFVSIFLMSIVGCRKTGKFSYLAMLAAYSSCFLLGGVFSFNNLYADLAFGSVFGATFILYNNIKQNKLNKNLLFILLFMLTLIKPSGCLATFTILLYILTEYLFNNNDKDKMINNMKKFIIDYWEICLYSLLIFIVWRLYVIITGTINDNFYDAIIIPNGLKSDLGPKLNISFIISFISKIMSSFDDTLIYSIINISLWQFIIIILTILFLIKKINKEKISIANFIVIYIAFFILTILSMYISFSYYEASIAASFGRYINSIHFAIIMGVLYLSYVNSFKNKKSIVILLLVIFSCSFNNMFYFITDFSHRKTTQEISNNLNDKFENVRNKTSKDASIYVLDQTDSDGIMAMWYARYYLFPRHVNASGNAITWKIKTSKNASDLQEWGLTSERLKEELIKYNFDYLYLYSIDDEAKVLLKNTFDNPDVDNYSLFKIEKIQKKIELKKVE